MSGDETVVAPTVSALPVAWSLDAETELAPTVVEHQAAHAYSWGDAAERAAVILLAAVAAAVMVAAVLWLVVGAVDYFGSDPALNGGRAFPSESMGVTGRVSADEIDGWAR